MNFFDKKPFIVAEISCNHQGKAKQAERLIQAAKDAGADAVKMQVYTAEDMTNDIEYKIKGGIWDGEKLYKLYQKTATDQLLAKDMFITAKEIGIPLFASVFSQEGIEFCEQYSCPAYKIASFEFTDYELIAAVADTNKPIVLSAGMSTYIERCEAIKWCTEQTPILLHCVSGYPTKLCHARLGTIQQYKSEHNVPVGFSDHTRGLTAGPLAAALGAVLIEKHLALPGTTPEDETFSLHPNEFGDYVKRIKVAAEAADFLASPEEELSRQFRRSLYAVQDIAEGEKFTEDNVRAMRPNRGLHPMEFSYLLDFKAKRYIYQGEPITKELINGK